MSSGRTAPRPFRRGICDGDDVWPSDITDAELRSIAAIDAETRAAEREPPPALKYLFGGGPIWSLAEHVRSWRSVVHDTEFGCHLHPLEYIDRIQTRDLLERHLAQLPDSLRARLANEVLDPLDARFEAATLDDDGVALSRELDISRMGKRVRWWSRRPINLGPLWDRTRSHDQIVQQRIRNRIMEYLEIAASFSEQRRYADLVPQVNVPYEVINQWQDWVPSGTFEGDASSGAFSDDEIAALVTYGEVWHETADSIPDDYPSIELVQSLVPWQRLRSQAKETLRVLEIRGHFQEER